MTNIFVTNGNISQTDRQTLSFIDKDNMRLTEPQTRALVTALTERLERVKLWYEVTLDIQTLCQHNGLGTCRKLEVADVNTRRRYGEDLKQWAAEVGWAVTDGLSLTCCVQKYDSSDYY